MPSLREIASALRESSPTDEERASTAAAFNALSTTDMLKVLGMTREMEEIHVEKN